ncbi:flagellar hook-associated protein FlgL [Paenibacillus sp. MAH-36]|uniref:Flagellar hook-associated protein FlgL n=2 Tax=Paenibacillus TaxID=44249 RepID=A0ABU3RN19_9BACL|nr:MULTISPECIES: flagellar hook-associated protein FlgL [Paenibacillus]MCY9660501.1 flagellar hook-associated protein FlgL [Paenibacillus anseongense]MDU0205690.1 flagellar hook-associated protein FlgL [Paenibacillus sp. PFR10]MEB4795112.1 flagellar hook-associated protein FlgL [Paenibacillus chondroitinus]
MTTRITQGMMNNQLLRNVTANLSRINENQNQLSTGRKINKPSDDPVGISFSLRYRSEGAANEQYKSNADSAVSWLDFTDTTLNQANTVIQRVRELTVQASNGTNPQSALDAIKKEIDQLSEQMVTIGNSQFNGKYVFNGQLTDKAPYNSATASTDVADQGEIKFDIGVGVRVTANVSGDKIFGAAGASDNIFMIMKDLSAALASGNQNDIGACIGKIDSRNEAFLQARADVGARQNRIELAQSRLEDIGTNLQTLQAKEEDADIPAVITNLKTDENVYNASLSVGSKIISTSLVDFLR